MHNLYALIIFKVITSKEAHIHWQ